MMQVAVSASGELSRWWKRSAFATMLFGFAILILLTVKAYDNAPPVPARAVDPSGAVIFTGNDITAGQEVFLKYGLMDNGTIWGHGAYLGPDFSAQYLHNNALDLGDHFARNRLGRGYAEISAEDRASIDAMVAVALKQNRYDPSSGTLTLLPGAAQSFDRQVSYWTNYFRTPAKNGGLHADAIIDRREIRDP